MSNLLPCATCPWRIDQKASSIPLFNHTKACDLRATVGDGDAMRPIMACHGSTEGLPRACNGYLARARLEQYIRAAAIGSRKDC